MCHLRPGIQIDCSDFSFLSATSFTTLPNDRDYNDSSLRLERRSVKNFVTTVGVKRKSSRTFYSSKLRLESLVP